MQSAESKSIGRFLQDGFHVIRSLVSLNECDRLCAELTPLFEEQLQRANRGIGGVRNLLSTNSLVAQFANNAGVLSLLELATGAPVFPVRSIFFDKNPDTNWLVPWHQDLAIAVVERIETAGFGGWSVKDGIIHVQPPVKILAGMITLRLHLDDCDAGNGALKVIAGSHESGKLSANKISRWTADHEPAMCEVPKGGALLMRPLLLHASSKAKSPRHRRVLHIEYATQPLPNGLRWRDH